jgi:hypothetical protein
LSDRASFFATSANEDKHVKIVLHLHYIKVGREYQQTVDIESDTRSEKATAAAKENHADVEKFAALDTRHDTHNGVVIRG